MTKEERKRKALKAQKVAKKKRLEVDNALEKLKRG